MNNSCQFVYQICLFNLLNKFVYSLLEALLGASDIGCIWLKAQINGG
jgi:hypothetical protein